MKGVELLSVMFHVSDPQRSRFKGLELYMLYLTHLLTSLLWKTCLNSDIRDKSLLMQILFCFASFTSFMFDMPPIKSLLGIVQVCPGLI